LIFEANLLIKSYTICLIIFSIKKDEEIY
jgi:hypothetical protein